MTMTRRVPNLGHVLKATLLCATISISRVHGQLSFLVATSVPRSNDVYEAYFGDGESTTAIGNRLPQCQGATTGIANLSLKLENNVTNQVIQQAVFLGSFGGLNWNTAQFPTLLSTLTGRYVCTIFSSSVMVTSTDTYQLNVVVPMYVNCTFPRNLALYNSTNMLSCNVTGYPQPVVSWSGINQIIPGNQTTSSNGTTHITSTVSFEGIEIASDAGDFVTINVTAQYPPFSCTSLQNPSTPLSLCDAIPKKVTYSMTLQVVGGCPAFNNTSWSPSTSPVANYQTNIAIYCAPGYTGSSPISVFCQSDGSWTAFPRCSGIDVCLSMPCRNGGTCLNDVNRFSCLCGREYTGQTCETASMSTNSPMTTTSFTEVVLTLGAHLPVWVIPVAAVAGVLLLLLIVLLIGCSLKRRSSPSPGKPKMQASHKAPPPQADLTMNAAYEDATTLSNAMTKSSAYELAAVPNQPNYDFIQPTQPIEYDYVTPR